MNIAFVIDTSPSMGQRTSQGASFLDCAKAGVEQLLKLRSRSGYENLNEKHHLILTDSSNPIRSSWEHDPNHFFKALSSVKRLTHNLSLNEAIAIAFKQLNLFRHMTSTDTYGYGRSPAKMESGVVIVMTDKQCEKLNTEAWKTPESSEFTQDAWRYDQRLFVVNFQAENHSTKDTQRIQSMLEVTGGALLICFSFRQILEIMQKVNYYLNEQVFTCLLESEERLSFPIICIVDKKIRNNYWPIPEEFVTMEQGLQTRPSNPLLYYRHTQAYSAFKLPQDFPFDSYEIIQTKIFMENFGSLYPSRPAYLPVYMQGHLHPFGVIALEESSAKLIVLVYNYLELWECIEFFRNPNAAKSEKSRFYEEKFLNYLKDLPIYYHHALNSVFRKIKLYIPHMKVPEQPGLPSEVSSKLKNKKEQETILWSEVEQVTKALAEQHSSQKAVCCQPHKYNLYSDVFKIPRKSLQGAISAMSQQFFGESNKHELPISKMGDFQSTLNSLPAIRSPYEEKELLKPPINFGNPFRKLNLSNECAKDSYFLIDDPNIALPTQNEKPEPKVQMVFIPIKRPRGFKSQLDKYKFLRRNSKVMLQAISYLRQNGPSADQNLVNLLKSSTSKVYKKKSSNTINAYTEGKVALLDAVASYAEAYKKPQLTTTINSIKLSVQNASY